MKSPPNNQCNSIKQKQQNQSKLAQIKIYKSEANENIRICIWRVCLHLVLDFIYKNIAKKMRKKAQAIRQYTFVATNISLNFNNSQELKNMLDPNASYQVIPCTTDAFFGDVWKIIIDILPCSKHILLDICLPFSRSELGRTTCHTARFFLLNLKILGIRIRTGNSWARYRCEDYRLPQQVVKYYCSSGSNSGITKCQIGQFYINHRNLKIVPLFSSEIQQNPNIMSEYERYGCDAFSIVDDIALDNLTDGSITSRKLLNKNEDKSCPILFTGCKTSTNPLKCYWTNAFIVQGENKKQISHNPFFLFQNIKLNINIDECVRVRNYTQIQKFLSSYKEEDPIVKDLLTKDEYIQFANPFISESSQKRAVQFKYERNLKKSILYIWFLYQQYNKGHPFTVGVPFTETILALAHLIGQMKALAKNYLKFDKPLLQIYHFPATDMRDSNFWPEALTICSESKFFPSTNALFDSQKTTPTYIYCEYLEQFKFFKQKTHEYDKIYLCKGLLVDKFITDKKVDRAYLRRNTDTIIQMNSSRTLQKLCEQILNKKYLNLQSMFNHFRCKDQDFNNLIQAFTVIMPRKIRVNMNLTAPHNYLLQTPKHRVKEQLQQIQVNLQLLSSGPKRSTPQIEATTMIDLQSKLKQVRQNKIQLKKQFSACHCCQQVIKKNLAKKCQKCKYQICIECNSNKFSNKNMEMQQFDKLISSNCRYCNQTCRCKSCLDKLEIRGKEQDQRNKRIQFTDYSIRTCFNCQVLGRKRKSIDIQCDSCHYIGCFQCVKVQEGITQRDFFNNWNCRKCKDQLNAKKQKIRNQIDIEKERQNQRTLRILPFQTSQVQISNIPKAWTSSLSIPNEGMTIDFKRSTPTKPKNTKKSDRRSSSSSSSSSSGSSSSSSSSQSKGKKKATQISKKSQPPKTQPKEDISKSKFNPPSKQPNNDFNSGSNQKYKNYNSNNNNNFNSNNGQKRNSFEGPKSGNVGNSEWKHKNNNQQLWNANSQNRSKPSTFKRENNTIIDMQRLKPPIDEEPIDY